MSSTLTAYRIFFASPGGLAQERKAFREVIANYNKSEAVERGAYFIPVGGELTLGGVGRPQEQINKDVRKCDYFVLMLWDRWGSAPGSNGRGQYSSGTEEEYHVALKSYGDQEQPMRQVVAFFKAVDAGRLSDPGEQLKQVLEFQKELEREKKLLFDKFDSPEGFENRLRAYLGQWMRHHEDGVEGKVRGPQPRPAPQITMGLRTADIPPETDEKLATQQKELRDAQRLADAGQLIAAEAIFAKSISRGDDPLALSLYGYFLKRLGRLAQAQVMYERILELTELPDAEKWQAIAFGDLGGIYETRGDLDQAEEMLRKSLEINKMLRRVEGMATNYGNLGVIYFNRCDLDEAEAMHRKALVLNEKLGGFAGMAINYGNLGMIYRVRGDLDQDEKMLRKALEINEKLGSLEGMAGNYDNLGLIYRTRGDLDQGEKMHRKALEINEKLSWFQGMASNYRNLGLIYQLRGELDQAEELHRKSLEIEEKLGRLEGMALSYGNLGLIYQLRGELDQAEKLHRKSLEIEEKLGRLDGMASNYGNLGAIYAALGDLDEAEALQRKSLAIEEKLGRLEGMALSYGNLGMIYQARGDMKEARTLWTRARDLFQKIGIPHEVAKVQKCLDELP